MDRAGEHALVSAGGCAAGDSGGEAFCFEDAGEVIVVGFISAREDNVRVGGSLEVMRRLGQGRLLS